VKVKETPSLLPSITLKAKKKESKDGTCGGIRLTYEKEEKVSSPLGAQFS
jgi:hypothetical protein